MGSPGKRTNPLPATKAVGGAAAEDVGGREGAMPGHSQSKKPRANES